MRTGAPGQNGQPVGARGDIESSPGPAGVSSNEFGNCDIGAPVRAGDKKAPGGGSLSVRWRMGRSQPAEIDSGGLRSGFPDCGAWRRLDPEYGGHAKTRHGFPAG